MPSVGGDAPFGSAGRVHADSRDSDADTPGAGTPAAGGGRHVADVGSGLPGGPAATDDDADLPYAFRRSRRRGTTTGSDTTGGSAGRTTGASASGTGGGGGAGEPGDAYRRGGHGDAADGEAGEPEAAYRRGGLGGAAGAEAGDVELPYAFGRGGRGDTGGAEGGDAGLPYAFRRGGQGGAAGPEGGAEVPYGRHGGPSVSDPAGDAEPYAFRRGRHGDATGAGLTVREVRGGLGRLVRGEWRPALALLAGGLLVAAVWRALGPSVADRGNPLEADVAVDGTLATLGILAGVVTSALVLLLPGRYPVRRTLVVVTFSVLGSVVSWQLGDLLGTPHLRAYGIVLIWPIITSAGLFAGSLLPGLSRRLED